MKYANIMNAFYSTPFAILPEKLAEIRAFLRVKANGGEIDPKEVAAIAAARRSDGVQMIGRVAVLPVFGVISQRVSMMDRASGGVSTEEIGQTLDNLVADKQVKTIVMAFDSPGGPVTGVPELAAKIRAARDQKRIIGLADPVAASAAYWLISQTSEIYATPSGQVGSIGVLAAHDDITAALEKIGVKTTLVTSAPFKAETYPETPLSEEARADMQAKVDKYHGMFVADIAAGRGTTAHRVGKDFGQGRMLLAKDALDAGMIDRVLTAEQLLAKLAASDAPKAQTTSERERIARCVEVETG